jgi:hypothetical protein
MNTQIDSDLQEVLLRAYYRGKDRKGYSDFELNQDIRQLKAHTEDYARKLALSVIGKDEPLPPRPPALDGALWEEFEVIRHNNVLRATQRRQLEREEL